MRFRIPDHAEREMMRRQIPREFVEAVLQNPQQIISERHGRKAYQSILDFGEGKRYLLRVIVKDDVIPGIVVTVYRTKKINKYWREQ
jgi:hypothetical protein